MESKYVECSSSTWNCYSLTDRLKLVITVLIVACQVRLRTPPLEDVLVESSSTTAVLRRRSTRSKRATDGDDGVPTIRPGWAGSKRDQGREEGV